MFILVNLYFLYPRHRKTFIYKEYYCNDMNNCETISSNQNVPVSGWMELLSMVADSQDSTWLNLVPLGGVVVTDCAH